MSEDLLLKAERRTKVGSVDTRRLRDQGRVPANIYGLDKPGVSASVCGDAVSKLVSTLSSVVDVELVTCLLSHCGCGISSDVPPDFDL